MGGRLIFLLFEGRKKVDLKTCAMNFSVGTKGIKDLKSSKVVAKEVVMEIPEEVVEVVLRYCAFEQSSG